MTSANLFARSRRRIVAVIMAVLAALFAATLIAIYAFSYAEVYDRNMRALESYAATYRADHLPPEFIRMGSQVPIDRKPPDRAHGAAPFYAVLFDSEGAVNAVDTGASDAYTDEELATLAESALSTGERSGTCGALLFAVERAPDYALVAFMDNTLVSESMGTLFRYTLIVGSVALVALFFVARWLAGRIVAPMQEAYEAQRRFISDAGHELKTPVAVVEANAELLRREAGDSVWLDNIRYENGRMGALVTQLLQLAHTEETTKTRETVDLSRIVEKEALSSEPIAFERNMPFTCEIEKDIEVEGDASELARLVAILLDNAFSHGVPGKPVALALDRRGQAARLTVTNGITLDDAEALRRTPLFERFARGDEARSSSDAVDANGTTASGHYGLGLAIARAIVEGHGGAIEVAVDENALSVTFEADLSVKKK